MLNVSINDIWQLNNENFVKAALDVYQFQYQHNEIYRSFSDHLQKNPSNVTSLEQLPFLPISFFKSHSVVTTQFEPEIVFESSGTTGMINSKHLVKDKSLYRKSFFTAFQNFYGNAEDYCILGLLPSYLERGSSSLVYMVDHLIKQSNHPESSFYLHDFDKLKKVLIGLKEKSQKTILIGVTYALLDFADFIDEQFPDLIIMETGGMKGRKKEILRTEVHEILKEKFGVKNIHSEYGMTELLSQAYSFGSGVFKTPGWMKVLLREEDDPLSIRKSGVGGINIIDLANIYSCSFIATEDVGKLYSNENFEVLGRLDNSDIRGCSLLSIN